MKRASSRQASGSQGTDEASSTPTASVVGKPILDVCCGSRMFWFDKQHPDTLYVDNRTMPPTKMSNGATIEVKPDALMDFRDLDLPDNSFSLVVFDPPHVLNAGDKSFLAKKYGYLKKESWQDDIKAGFAECFRVLKPNGVLIFKWHEMHIPVKDIIALSPYRPLFGNRSGKSSKTHWLCFMKPPTLKTSMETTLKFQANHRPKRKLAPTNTPQ